MNFRQIRFYLKKYLHLQNIGREVLKKYLSTVMNGTRPHAKPVSNIMEQRVLSAILILKKDMAK